MSAFDPDWAANTLGVRAFEPTRHEGEHSAAIHPTSSFVHRSAAHAAKVFSGEEPGQIYSRFTNPTVQAFEQRLAAMEGRQQELRSASSNYVWMKAAHDQFRVKNAALIDQVDRLEGENNA